MKFWVNVDSVKHPHSDEERVYTAVYGDINDAVAYAQNYLLPSFGRYEITIRDKNLNTVYHEIW